MDSYNKIYKAGDTVIYNQGFWTFVEYTTDNEQCVLFSRKNGWETAKAQYVFPVGEYDVVE